MRANQTEWKTVAISKAKIDFCGAIGSHLEADGDSFIALTMKLKCGRTIRIRKSDYGVRIEEPVIPMRKKYIVKTDSGLSATLDDESEAQRIAEETPNATLHEIEIPVQDALESLPF